MKTLKKVIVFTFLAVLVISYYIHLTSKTANDVEATVDNSVVGTLLAVNMELNYPSTPKDVVELYSKIIKAFYGEEMTEDQLIGLAQRARAMFDSELLSYNSYNTYIQDLKTEIESYKLQSKKISAYSVERASHTVFINEDDSQYARINALYYVVQGKSGTDRTKTYERYTLRKDVEGKWKIVYWELIPEKDFHGE